MTEMPCLGVVCRWWSRSSYLLKH